MRRAATRTSYHLGRSWEPCPMCRQLVTKFTYRGRNGGKIYDVLLTNMGQFYNIPYIAKAVSPDEANSRAVPSDHDMAVAEPLAGAGCASSREYTVRTSQPFPQSGLSQFGAWLHTVDWQPQWFRLVPLTRFGPILRKKSSGGRNFFLVRATAETKIVLKHKLPNTDYRRCTR